MPSVFLFDALKHTADTLRHSDRQATTGVREYEPLGQIEIHIQPSGDTDIPYIDGAHQSQFYRGYVDHDADIREEDRIITTQNGYDGTYEVHDRKEYMETVHSHFNHIKLILRRIENTDGVRNTSQF